MKSSPSARSLAAFVVIGGLLTGCGTSRGLGLPPTDDQLVHDQTPEGRQALREKYAVVYEKQRFYHPEQLETARVSSDILGLNVLGSPVGSDEAETYLRDAEGAAEVLDRPAPTAADILAGDSGALAVGLTAGGAALLLGLGVGVVAVAPQFAQGIDANTATNAATSMGVVAAGAGAASLAFGTIGLFAHSLIVEPLVFLLAESDLREAATLYNQDLEARLMNPAAPEQGNAAKSAAADAPSAPAVTADDAVTTVPAEDTAAAETPPDADSGEGPPGGAPVDAPSSDGPATATDAPTPAAEG